MRLLCCKVYTGIDYAINFSERLLNCTYASGARHADDRQRQSKGWDLVAGALDQMAHFRQHFVGFSLSRVDGQRKSLTGEVDRRILNG